MRNRADWSTKSESKFNSFPSHRWLPKGKVNWFKRGLRHIWRFASDWNGKCYLLLKSGNTGTISVCTWVKNDMKNTWGNPPLRQIAKRPSWAGLILRDSLPPHKNQLFQCWPKPNLIRSEPKHSFEARGKWNYWAIAIHYVACFCSLFAICAMYGYQAFHFNVRSVVPMVVV